MKSSDRHRRCQLISTKRPAKHTFPLIEQENNERINAMVTWADVHRVWNLRPTHHRRYEDESFIVRSPFRAKHHVVVQYMAAGPKCPLPPSPCGTPLPPWPDPPKDSMTGRGQGEPGRIDEQGRIDDITDATRDFALQLPWALLLVQQIAAAGKNSESLQHYGVTPLLAVR